MLAIHAWHPPVGFGPFRAIVEKTLAGRRYIGSEISGSAKRSTAMWLTGKEVWDAIVKAGYLRGPYDPSSNVYCAHADVLAELLNEVLSKRDNRLPSLLETEDAMRVWEAGTPREYVLRLYKFLNQCGYTVIGIDAAIEREASRRKTVAAEPSNKHARHRKYLP